MQSPPRQLGLQTCKLDKHIGYICEFIEILALPHGAWSEGWEGKNYIFSKQAYMNHMKCRTSIH